MSTKLMTEKYATDIHGVLNCYDRVLISGNLQPLCYAQGMTKYLYTHQIRIFDYTKEFAEPLRTAIRARAQQVAHENGLEIEFITKQGAFRKEDRIQQILTERGHQPGLVHIFSAMERCPAYQPGVGLDLPTGANLVSVPLTAVLQWAQRPGGQTQAGRD